MSYSYMIGDYLQRFEITTSYTSSFTYDPELVRCDPEHIFYFKKFCDHLNNGAILRPYRYYLAHNMTGACQLEYYQIEKESSKAVSHADIKNEEIVNKSNKTQASLNSNNTNLFTFRLFYVFPYNQTHDEIRVYNESTDFRNWNYLTEGQFVQFIDSSLSSTRFRTDIVLKEPYWTTGIAAFGSQNESRVFTIIYPILSDYNETESANAIYNDINSNLKKNITDNSKRNNGINAKYQHWGYNTTNNELKNNQNIKLTNDTRQNSKYYLNLEEVNNHKIYKSEKNESFWFAHSIDEAKIRANQSNFDYRNQTKKCNAADENKIVVTSVGSSFFTESLYDILMQRTQAKNSHFIVTDYTYSVLIDNEIGAIYPKLFNDKNMSIFPNISDMNSSLWKSVEKEIVEVPIDIPLLVNISSSEQYMIMKRIIDTRSRYSFYLIMLLELNPTIAEIYSSITNVFISCLIMIFVVLFFLRISIFYINQRRRKKLKFKQEQMLVNNFSIYVKSDNIEDKDNDTNLKKSKNQNNDGIIQFCEGNSNIYYDVPKNNGNKEYQKDIKTYSIMDNYHGVLIDAIEKLRVIQLRNADDIFLNNMIDATIEEMTRSDDELFSIEFSIKSNSNNSNNHKNMKKNADSSLNLSCPFCSYLIDYNSNLSILKDNDIANRKLNEKEKLKRNKILDNILNSHSSDKNKKDENNNYFYRDPKEKNNDKLFTIWNHKINTILNEHIDDDLLNTNPHKYLIRKFMKFIQKEKFLFNDFYPDSLMLFVLSFTQENIVCYHCKIQSFYFLKKLMKDNFKFWIKDKNDIFILFLASILRNSKIKNSDQILNEFRAYTGFNNTYFFNLLKSLIDETTNNNVMKLYGVLFNRALSPNFSIPNNTKDAILFMKAILIFSDFAPYLTSTKQNEKCFNEISQCVFTNEEKENQKFISNFHLGISKNVAAPWLNLMNSFSPMHETQNILSKNINFWLRKSLFTEE